MQVWRACMCHVEQVNYDVSRAADLFLSAMIALIALMAFGNVRCAQEHLNAAKEAHRSLLRLRLREVRHALPPLVSRYLDL